MKKIFDSIFVLLAGWVIWFLTYLLSLTIRWVYVRRKEFDDIMSKTATVAVFWHGEFLLLPSLHKNKRVVIIISRSKDGDIATDVIKRYGLEVVRGSSTRGGETATRETMRYIENKYTLALTGDGPKGPYHVLKPGPVWFAQKMNIPLITVTVRFKHFIQVKSWDRFLIPIPFTKGVVIYGEPISLAGLQRREGMQIVQQYMAQQELTAQRMLDQSR
jgi:lysophospholipid acyltransferase (LPLAT)-like uncharacterized protein